MQAKLYLRNDNDHQLTLVTQQHNIQVLFGGA